jgi:hypothetical protein
MRLTLTEDEARRYGREGEMVVVRAVCVRTDRAALENFRQFLSVTQDDRDSPFRELVDEIRAGSVSVLEAGGPGTLRSLLRSHGVRSSCSSTQDQRRRYERLRSFWRRWAQANLIHQRRSRSVLRSSSEELQQEARACYCYVRDIRDRLS